MAGATKQATGSLGQSMLRTIWASMIGYHPLATCNLAAANFGMATKLFPGPTPLAACATKLGATETGEHPAKRSIPFRYKLYYNRLCAIEG